MEDNRGKIIAYFHLKKIDDKSKTRLDCIKSIGEYQPIEQYRKKGILKFYLTENYTSSDVDMALKETIEHITSISRPEINSDWGLGDVKHTSDAILFRFRNFQRVDTIIQKGSELELFIIKDAGSDKTIVYQMAKNGIFDSEIQQITLNQ